MNKLAQKNYNLTKAKVLVILEQKHGSMTVEIQSLWTMLL